jgi:hypothetical protein
MHAKMQTKATANAEGLQATNSKNASAYTPPAPYRGAANRSHQQKLVLHAMPRPPSPYHLNKTKVYSMPPPPTPPAAPRQILNLN